MPLTAVAFAASMLLAACSADDSSATPTSTEGASAVATDAVPSQSGSDYLNSYTLTDEEYGTMVRVTVDGSTRSIEANALPNHETGEFPNQGNPNTISEQDARYEYTTEPVYVGSATEVRTTGVAANGVKFEPGTAETVMCESGETLRIEALQDTYDLGLDFNNAHVQPTGEYHYHGVSELLVDAYSSDQDLVQVGFAADGFLMYYSKSGSYGSGYELSTEGREGTDCVASGPLAATVDIDGTTPDGTYTSDWVWSEDAGELDRCNGVEVNGEYVYIITNEYPYVGRCLNGEVSGEGVGGAGPEGAAPDAAPSGAAPGEAPDLSEAAALLGISENELSEALGGPPPDFEAAAETLGISVEELTAAMPAGPGQG